MTIRYFRFLLIASLLTGIVGGSVDLAFPALLPDAFRQAQEAQDAQSTSLIAFLGIASLVLLVVFPACFYGLYMFRPWAPRLSLLCTALMLPILLAGGPFAQSGLTIAASYLSSYLWGAVLILAFCPPFSGQFQRQDG